MNENTLFFSGTVTTPVAVSVSLTKPPDRPWSSKIVGQYNIFVRSSGYEHKSNGQYLFILANNGLYTG